MKDESLFNSMTTILGKFENIPCHHTRVDYSDFIHFFQKVDYCNSLCVLTFFVISF